MKSFSSVLSRVVVSGFTVVYPYVLISTAEYATSFAGVVAAMAAFNLFSLVFSFSLNLEFFSTRNSDNTDLRVIYFFSFLLLVLSLTVLILLKIDLLFFGELLSAFIIAFVLLVADKERAEGLMGRYLVWVLFGYGSVFGVAIVQLHIFQEYLFIVILRILLAIFVMVYLLCLFRWRHIHSLIAYLEKHRKVIILNFVGLLSFWMLSQLDRFLINILDKDIADAYAKTLLSFTSISVVLFSLPIFVGGIIKSEWDKGNGNRFYLIVRQKLAAFVMVGLLFGAAQTTILDLLGVLVLEYSFDYFLAMLCFLVFCSYLALVRVKMVIMNYQSRSQERLVYMFLFIPIPIFSVLFGVFCDSALLIFISNSVLVIFTYHFLADRLMSFIFGVVKTMDFQIRI